MSPERPLVALQIPRGAALAGLGLVAVGKDSGSSPTLLAGAALVLVGVVLVLIPS